MTKQEKDPLRNADIGTTRTIRDTKYIDPWDYYPDVLAGTDRFGHLPEITSVEIVEDDRHGDELLAVTFEAEVTKQLPLRWDYAREPRTESERERQRRNERFDKVMQAFGFLLPVGFALGAGFWIMNKITPLQLESTTVPSPTALDVGFTLGILLFVTVFIVWAVRGGVPPRV